MDSLERDMPGAKPKLEKVESEKWKKSADIYEKLGRESFQLKRLPS